MWKDSTLPRELHSRTEIESEKLSSQFSKINLECERLGRILISFIHRYSLLRWINYAAEAFSIKIQALKCEC